MAILALYACSKTNSQTSHSSSTTESSNQIEDTAGLSNPESAKRNTDIPPAFDGQTRVQGLKTQADYQVNVIAENLGNPWGIINLPDGRFLITEKSGFAYIISEDGQNVKKVTGFPSVDDKGQGGLLDIALDPDFSSNRLVYWSYTEPVKGGNHTSVAKGKLSENENQIVNTQVIFRAIPVYDGDKHYGSRLVFDQDGNLFVSTGERSDLVTRPLAQDQTSYLGKVLKITKDGNPAPNNPKMEGWQPEIYSTGHRSPQGTAIHPQTGELWLAEMGPKGGDEINLIQPGKNYGWPTITYGVEYSGKTIGDGIGQLQDLEQPVYFWDPSVSPSGITFYTGNIAEWKNNMMIGCLSGKKIIRLVIEDNKVIGEEWLLTDMNERIRDVLDASNGNLYAITDSGKLIRIGN